MILLESGLYASALNINGIRCFAFKHLHVPAVLTTLEEPDETTYVIWRDPNRVRTPRFSRQAFHQQQRPGLFSLSLTQAFFVQTHCCFGERITQAKLYLFFRVKFATGLSCRVLCSISRRDLFRTDNIPFGARVFLDSRRPSAFWDLDIRLERRWCTSASRSFLS
jgi:hypothetical protein